MEGFSAEGLRERFKDNLGFFKHHLPKLYEQLLPAPCAYNLLWDSGGLNILNLSDGSLLFPCIGGEHQMFNISKDWASHILNNPKWTLNDNGLILGDLDLKALPLTNQACQDILELSAPNAPYHLGQNFYPPTILYGMAGGLFLALLLEQGAFFHALYIYEEHIDLLRISCYFIDYPQLFYATPPQACAIFLKNLPTPFFKHAFLNKRITHSFLHLEFDPYKSENTQRAQELFCAHKKSALRGWGSFEDEMLGLSNSLQNLKESRHILDPKTCPHMDLPICVVGNGPSLDGLLDFIQSNQENMLIFSCGTALKVLKAHQIHVDFQIEIERIDYLKEVLLDAPLGDTPLMCANMINTSARQLAKEVFMFMRGGSASGYLFPHLAVEYSAPFVGNAGVALACLFSQTLILCGLDCGYIQGASKHAKGSYYGEEGTQIPPDALSVRPNFEGTLVYSDGLFLLSKEQMGMLFKKHGTLVYNLSNGAFIENTIPKRAQDLLLKKGSKSKALKRIKRAFKPQAPINLPLEGLQAFKEQIKQLLQKPMRTKKELYARMDDLSALSLQKSQEDPLVGILLEGSLAHLGLHALAVSLSLKQSQVPAFYAQIQEIITATLDKMVARCHWLAMGSRSKWSGAGCCQL